MNINRARAGERVGLIWVLVISTALAAALLLGFWVVNSHHMNSASDTKDARTRTAVVSGSNSAEATAKTPGAKVDIP